MQAGTTGGNLMPDLQHRCQCCGEGVSGEGVGGVARRHRGPTNRCGGAPLRLAGERDGRKPMGAGRWAQVSASIS